MPWGEGEELRKARLGSRRWIYSDFIFISFSWVKFYTASPWPAGFNHSKRTLFIKCLFQAVSNPSAPALFSIVSRNISSPGGLWIALESGEVRIYLLLTEDLSRQRLQLRQEADTLCQAEDAKWGNKKLNKIPQTSLRSLPQPGTVIPLCFAFSCLLLWWMQEAEGEFILGPRWCSVLETPTSRG